MQALIPNPVSVVICTRNRGDSVVETIRSILGNSVSNFELVIMDQSENDLTDVAVQPFLSDSRVRYFRTNTKGLGVCRNLAIEKTVYDTILMTDDDCVAPPDWIANSSAIFQEFPQIGMVFGTVEAGSHDSALGYIPAYHPGGSYLVTSSRDKCKARGIGACMSLRKSLAISLGGFDEMLGAGGPFFSCEDGDMSVRMLLNGHPLYETDRVSVVHNGFRTWEQGRKVAHKDFLAIGASYSKPLKCGHWGFWVVPAYEFFAMAVLPPIKDLLSFRKPRGFKRITGFIHGFFVGLKTPVEKKTLLFRKEAQNS